MLIERLPKFYDEEHETFVLLNIDLIEFKRRIEAD